MLERTHCPLCRGPADPIFTRPFSHPSLQAMLASVGLSALGTGKPFEVRLCGGCQFAFQSWVAEECEAASLFGARRSEADFRAQMAGQKLHAFAHQIEEVLILRQVCSAPAPAVLDFGCAWGKWASAAIALGCEAWGVELDPVAAGLAARRGVNIVPRRDLAGLSFDFINVDQVLEHLADPLGLLGELRGRLKPGGLLKLSTPGDPRLPERLRAAQAGPGEQVLQLPALDALYPLEHVNLFNRHSLLEAARRAGLVPYRLPLGIALGAGQLWNLPRQLNRNLVVPFKRWLGRGTYQWFRERDCAFMGEAYTPGA